LTNGINPTRLFVLGALLRHGPMYGHQIRRDARVDRTELWSEVRPGSLYGALHRMSDEGLIVPVRTEKEGNLPTLVALRSEAFRQVGLRPDPVDLALAMSDGLSEDELRGLVDDRRRTLLAQFEFFRHEQERSWADKSCADRLILDHLTGRLEAEISWHDEVLAAVAKLCDPARATRAVPANEPLLP
jgi:hypothetical protein